MEVSLSTTIATVAGAVCLAYINGFVVESFKRHNDGSALAAGLAGELASYGDALPMLSRRLHEFIEMLDAGSRGEITLRPIERPADRFYEASVGKLGLLGPDLVERVVLVYGNIGAFRVSMGILGVDHASMSDAELRQRLQVTIECLVRAAAAGTPLIAKLRARAVEAFWPVWAWTGR